MSRYSWDLESWGSWCRSGSNWFFWDDRRGRRWPFGKAGWVFVFWCESAAPVFKDLPGARSMLLCSEVLKERIKRKGVWLVVPLDVKRWSYGLIRHLEGIFFVPEVGSLLKEGIFAWVKGIGSMFRIPCLGIWSRRRKPGKSRCRRWILVPGISVRGRGAFLDV